MMPAQDMLACSPSPSIGQACGPILAEHAAFIAGASLVFVFSSPLDAAPDVSPRGDAPGFVRIVDDTRILLPDRMGNNRIDSMQNLIQDPRLALIFLKVQDPRALQITGSAKILTDPELLSEFAYKDRLPRSVMDVVVTSAELRYSGAFAAANLWLTDAASEVPSVASLGEILFDQVGGMTREEADAFIANSYTNKLY